MSEHTTGPQAGAWHRRSLLKGGALGAGLVAGGAVLDVAGAATAEVTHRHWSGHFKDPGTQDWVYLPFDMPRGVQSVRVGYDFDPHDTGLGFSTNVVDIGIFDSSGRGLGDAAGFRGWSGGARRHFRITEHRATPGYLAGPLTPGRWHIVLGPFLITPPGTPWTVTLTLVHGKPERPPFEAHPAPVAVPGTAAGWYRGDLHTHTVHSDGRWQPAQLLAAARARGLDFLGTSDHNTSSSTRVWGKVVPDDFLLVSGEEVTTRNGHWLSSGTPAGTWIDWRYRATDGKLGRFTDLTRSLGGVAIAAHPRVPITGTRWDFGFDDVDALEVWNGPWSFFNQQMVAAWQQMLAAGTYVPGVGNSDSHHDGQVVGLPMTSYRLGTLATADVVAAVRGGHAWLGESDAVDLTFTATGTGATTVVGEPGDTVALTAGEQLAVHLDVTGVPGTVAQLFGASGLLTGAVADASGRVVIDTTVDPVEGFVRAEVRRPGGTLDPLGDQSAAPMVALTNPVFAG